MIHAYIRSSTYIQIICWKEYNVAESFLLLKVGANFVFIVPIWLVSLGVHDVVTSKWRVAQPGGGCGITTGSRFPIRFFQDYSLNYTARRITENLSSSLKCTSSGDRSQTNKPTSPRKVYFSPTALINLKRLFFNLQLNCLLLLSLQRYKMKCFPRICCGKIH